MWETQMQQEKIMSSGCGKGLQCNEKEADAKEPLKAKA